VFSFNSDAQLRSSSIGRVIRGHFSCHISSTLQLINITHAQKKATKKVIVSHTKMNINSTKGLLALFAFVFFALGNAQNTLVPAIITFGDSAVDVGNNDYLPTIFKANYLPYGRDFFNHQPTGRFCNGKLATDITGEEINLNFKLTLIR